MKIRTDYVTDLGSSFGLAGKEKLSQRQKDTISANTFLDD